MMAYGAATQERRKLRKVLEVPDLVLVMKHESWLTHLWRRWRGR